MAKLGTSPYYKSNVVAYEENTAEGFCEDDLVINVATETTLSVGSVLGKVTATGKYAPRDPDGADGSEVSAAVCLENITVPATTDTTVAGIVNGSVILKEAGLVFDVAHDAGQKATAISELEALDGVVKVK